MIQKQIYEAAKKHKLNYVFNLQNYLINSNEAKLFSLMISLNKLSTYYVEFEGCNFMFNIANNLSFLHSIFNSQVLNHRTTKVVLEKTKQILICLSLEPNRKAKLKESVYKNFFISSSYIFLLRNNESSYTKNINTYKSIFINIVVSKARSCKYVTCLIKSWLYSGYFNIKSILYNKMKSKSFNNVLKNYFSVASILSSILSLDMFWFLFNITMKQSNLVIGRNNKLYSLENIKNFKYDNCYISYKNFNKFIIIFLYRYRYRFSKYKIINLLEYPSKIISNIREVYNKYFYNYKKFVTFYEMNLYNKCVNIFFFNWLKKKLNKNNNLFITIQKLNSNINVFTYYYNTYDYYKC
uniref:Reverse transcriptase N-terminal domain-containing protein n=1 Tax=Chondria tumulosa TaxID=2740715 RepID=A0A896SR70_9FLOR|nr:hypothetical protein K8K75_pgp120 [Chondria tumulosa]QSD57087.1 hypothetical protein [Chondria tumulosa]